MPWQQQFARNFPSFFVFSLWLLSHFRAQVIFTYSTDFKNLFLICLIVWILINFKTIKDRTYKMVQFQVTQWNKIEMYRNVSLNPRNTTKMRLHSTTGFSLLPWIFIHPSQHSVKCKHCVWVFYSSIRMHDDGNDGRIESIFQWIEKFQRCTSCGIDAPQTIKWSVLVPSNYKIPLTALAFYWQMYRFQA